MPPRDWKRETRPGPGLRRSNRIKVVNFSVSAEVDQLWRALALHHGMPLNGTLAWALEELAKRGVTNGKRPPDMGAGLKEPLRMAQAGNKYSAGEDALWQTLATKYRCGRFGVATLALIELYWREPTSLSVANLSSQPRRYKEIVDVNGRVIAWE